MTVEELIEELMKYDSDIKVKISWEGISSDISEIVFLPGNQQLYIYSFTCYINYGFNILRFCFW